MQITVAQGAAKHQLSVDAGETIRVVKARLSALCDIPAEQQRLLVKGKSTQMSLPRMKATWLVPTHCFPDTVWY